MSEVDTDQMARLGFLRALRDAGAPVRMYELPQWSAVASYLLPGLIDRGLVISRYGGGALCYTTSGAADRLLEALDEVGARMISEFESCGYTMSHTSAWCGNPYCR